MNQLATSISIFMDLEEMHVKAFETLDFIE